jgi:hypothetical protein
MNADIEYMTSNLSTTQQNMNILTHIHSTHFTKHLQQRANGRGGACGLVHGHHVSGAVDLQKGQTSAGLDLTRLHTRDLQSGQGGGVERRLACAQ